jgi:hypothetical protein
MPAALDRTALIQFKVAATGSLVPTQFPVLIRRLNGSAFATTVNVPANDSVDVPVPVGIYQIRITIGSNCVFTVPGVAFDYAVIPHVLRAGESTRIQYQLTCGSERTP